MSEFDYANDWNWRGSADWQGSADWSSQFNSLAPGDGRSGSSWMRRLCPLTDKETVDYPILLSPPLPTSSCLSSYLILDYVDLCPFTDFVEYFMFFPCTDFVELCFPHSIADHVGNTQQSKYANR